MYRWLLYDSFANGILIYAMDENELLAGDCDILITDFRVRVGMESLPYPWSWSQCHQDHSGWSQR